MDKYLSASGVDVLFCSAETLRIKLHEAGPFALWSEQDKPKASGLEFQDLGNGLYLADMPVKAGEVILTITR